MHMRPLGHTGTTVGALGLGCMGMTWAYGHRDDAESIRVIHRAIDSGVNLIDTADVYGPHTNEELVGKALAGRRDSVVLATKCGCTVENAQEYIYGRNGTPEHIRTACDLSLLRLGVDVIDLYYLHRVDPNVPIEESVGAMADLVTAGKVRWIGLSETDVPTLERAMAVHPITALQSELSLWTRDPLTDVVPWCQRNAVAYVAFSPLGRGFLSGKLRSADFGKDDFRTYNPRFAPEAVNANLAIVDAIETVAERHNATTAQIALAWVLAQGNHVIPIPGTKHVNYLDENLASGDIQLSLEDISALDALPQPVGARYR